MEMRTSKVYDYLMLQILNVNQLLSSALKTDIEHAVEEARLARLSEFDAFSSRRWWNISNKSDGIYLH